MNLPSSSHSPPSNVIKDSEPCLICGAPTLERHFQVITCNACAAFFRRSIKIRSSYRCQRNHGTCNLSVRKVGRPLCRYCRLKKCYEVGMKSDENNIKLVDPKFEKPDSPKPVFPEEKINNCVKDATKVRGISINVEKVYQEIKTILEQKPKSFTSMDNFNLTKKFAEILAKFSQKPREMTFFDGTNGDYEGRTKEHEKYLVSIARMLMNIEYYAALPFPEKFALFKKFWQKFHIIDRIYLTLLYFGNNIEDCRIAIDTRYFIYIREEKFTQSEMSNETALFIFPLFAKMKIQLEHIKKTGLTLFEFSYICQIILWSCAEIEEISLPTCALAEEMMQKASDELHDYYVNELHMKNYAARQADLIKQVRLTEFVYRDRRQMMAANQIFNFIESHLNMNVLT